MPRRQRPALLAALACICCSLKGAVAQATPAPPPPAASVAPAAPAAPAAPVTAAALPATLVAPTAPAAPVTAAAVPATPATPSMPVVTQVVPPSAFPPSPGRSTSWGAGSRGDVGAEAFHGKDDPAVRAAVDAGDLDPNGPCKAELESLCHSRMPGKRLRAHCLRQAEIAALQRKEHPLSQVCQKHVRAFFIAAAHLAPATRPHLDDLVHVAPVAGFREACRADSLAACPGKFGQTLIQCLKKQVFAGNLTSQACHQKVFEIQEREAETFGLDYGAYEACSSDLAKNCQFLSSDLAQAGGREACLKRHRQTLSDRCREKLFHKEQRQAEDVRLNAAFYSACKAEIGQFCGNSAFGEGRMLKCLWEQNHMKQAEFGASCSEQVKNVTRRSSHDYRLDWRVRTRCESEISRHCQSERQHVDGLSAAELFSKTDWLDGQSGQVIRCLKNHYAGLTNDQCKKEVQRIVRVHSTSTMADAPLIRACQADIRQVCPGLTGHRAHLCLRRNINRISQECKQAELEQGSAEAHQITMKGFMFYACRHARREHCADVPTGSAQVIQCLQDKMHKDDFPRQCREIVELELEASNHDWRLKYGISTACQSDARTICGEDKMEEGGGQVLRCLKTNANNITRQPCKTEVDRYMKQGATNIKFAPTTYDHCLQDVTTFCDDVEPGGGRVHQCLVEHMATLTSDCRQAEFQEQKILASDIRKNPRASKACYSSWKMLCPAEQNTGSGAIWKCMEDKKTDPGMTAACRQVVTAHEKVLNYEFHLNPDLSKYCASDSRRHCPTEVALAAYKDFSDEGAVVGCLIEHRAEVKDPTCKLNVLRKQLQRLENMQNDRFAWYTCQIDVEKYCQQDQGKGNFRVHHCLSKHFDDLSPPCKEVQFSNMVMMSEDIRLNPSTNKKCKLDVTRFCPQVPQGTGQVILCLLENLHKTAMSFECRKAMEMEQAKQSKTISFQPFLLSQCQADLDTLQRNHTKDCTVQGPLGTMNGAAIHCLMTNRRAVQGLGCKNQILRLSRRQASDYRAKPMMKKACGNDIERLCGDVGNGRGRVQACLRSKRGQLQSDQCKALLQEVEEAELEDATVNPRVRRECAGEAKAFCKRIEPGNSRILVCLKRNEEKLGFAEACRHALAQLHGLDQVVKVKGNDYGDLQNLLNWVKEHSRTKWWGIGISVALSLCACIWVALIYTAVKRHFAKGAFAVVSAEDA